MKQTIMKPHCLYCGEPKEEHWDEYTKYYKCGCEDALYKRDLMNQINGLIKEANDKLPTIKFEIIDSPNENLRFIRMLKKPIRDSFL